MADKFEKQLDDAIEEIVKGYKKAAIIAAREATEKTAEVIYNKALSCLEEYYNSYKPTSYDRTNSLRFSFVKDWHIKSKGNDIVCSMGVVYDPTRLDGFYYKTRSLNYLSYREPDSQWVIDNYLEGIHPTTDGSSKFGEAKYIEKKGMLGAQSATYRMEAFLDWKAVKEFQGWFYTSLLNQALKLIK